MEGPPLYVRLVGLRLHQLETLRSEAHPVGMEALAEPVFVDASPTPDLSTALLISTLNPGASDSSSLLPV